MPPSYPAKLSLGAIPLLSNLTGSMASAVAHALEADPEDIGRLSSRPQQEPSH